MENKSIVNVTNKVLPPNAKETEASASETHNIQFVQKDPPMIANPSPSAPPNESSNQENVMWQIWSEFSGLVARRKWMLLIITFFVLIGLLFYFIIMEKKENEEFAHYMKDVCRNQTDTEEPVTSD